MRFGLSIFALTREQAGKRQLRVPPVFFLFKAQLSSLCVIAGKLNAHQLIDFVIMGFKWRPYTVDTISSALPGVVIKSISKEVEVKGGDELSSWAFVYRLEVLDVRDNALKFIVKRVKKPSGLAANSDNVKNMLKSYSNEINFYLHFHGWFEGGLFIPKMWSSNSNDRTGAFTLLLSDIKPNFNIEYTNLNLPHEEVYKALTFLAGFHATYWELNDSYDDNLLFKRGGICAVAGEDDERVRKIEDPWDRLRDAR